MKKEEFLSLLRNALNGLPEEDIEERLSFYSEMIEDGMEDGLSEEEVINNIGSVEEIVFQIVDEIPLTKLVKEKIKPKRKISVFEIILLVLGFPVWGSLLISAFAVILALYISYWAVVISLWAVFASFIACALGGIIGGTYFALNGKSLQGLVIIAGGILCIGLGILMFYACKAATKGAVIIIKKIISGIKKLFVKKEEK